GEAEDEIGVFVHVSLAVNCALLPGEHQG
ncbi:MAG: hypothetical protein H6R26_3281, partial [Proteobacteria bacterium]|nr:hypothetical protein [Pseudomonadota bacterium]